MPAQFQQYQPPAAPQYAQPPMPGYPAQPYGQVPVQQYAPQPMPSTSLDDFYNQPSTGGGPGWKFQTIGTRHVGQVARPLHDGDVQPVTDFRTGAITTYRDGRPKMQLVIPLIEPNGENATWYVKGKDRDALAAAMAAAGAPAGPPEAGAWIMVTYVADKPSGQGLNPTKVKDVQYVRPGADAPATPAPQVAPAGQLGQPIQQPLPTYQPQPGQQFVAQAAPAQQAAAPAQAAQLPANPAPAGVGSQPMPAAPQVANQAPTPGQMIGGELSQDQAALFAAMLQGGQPPAQQG